MQIGRKIYYDNRTGEILVDTGEKSGDIRDTTQEEDIAAYPVLSERSQDTFGVLKLEYGQFAQDFNTGILNSVDLTELKPLFSYPDPQIENPEPIKPLSVEVAEIKAKQDVMQQALDDLLLGGGL